MEEKAQEEKVSDATLAATNGYMDNKFITAKVLYFDMFRTLEEGQWREVHSIKHAVLPGWVTIVFRDDGTEVEVNANHTHFALRLI